MDSIINLLSGTQAGLAVLGLIILGVYESFHPFFDFFKNSTKDRNRHYLKNLIIGGVNALIITLIFSGLWLWATLWADEHSIGLLHWIEPFLGEYALILRVALVLLLFDFWMYSWHRINHAIPFLWRFHRLHHSDPFMNVTTATRFHMGEIILSSALRVPILILLGMHLWELLVYEIIAVLVIQFHHANIQIPKNIDAWLRRIIITPSLHKVHHSDWQPETDSNFGSLFSFWDVIFSTFRTRKNLEEIQLGLKEFKSEESQKLKNLFKQPLEK